MEHSITIEPMKLKDLEAVAAIENASFQDPWPLRSFLTELQENRLAVYLVARNEEGEVIGYLGAWIIIDEVHITTLAVTMPYRRQGVASRLVETMLQDNRMQEGRVLTLEVRPSNTAARRFYEKLGLKIYGRRKRYYSNEDALIMSRENLLPPGSASLIAETNDDEDESQ
ncbi:MAG: ribosomal protein S18-alanine N-acetyltransferase [Dethiobacteria bacterium]|nr:ribosomal protein S18-alanine N-acetyltransferase [Dethiobacteria bacterium]